MEYDPYERFREDPGEMELSDEFNAQLQLQQQAEELAEPEETTPTGGQLEQSQPPAPSNQTPTSIIFKLLTAWKFRFTQPSVRIQLITTSEH